MSASTSHPRRLVWLAPRQNWIEDRQSAFITGFLDRVSGAVEQIRTLANDQSVLIILTYQMDRVPFVGLSGSQIEKIAELGAGIDVDIMVD